MRASCGDRGGQLGALFRTTLYVSGDDGKQTRDTHPWPLGSRAQSWLASGGAEVVCVAGVTVLTHIHAKTSTRVAKAAKEDS